MKFLSMVIAIGALVTSSCKEKIWDVTLPTEKVTNPINENGELSGSLPWKAFNSMKEFEQTMLTLHSLHEDELLNWEKSQKGFISWLSKTKAQNDSVAEIPDIQLATILDKEGRIQVADTIYQFVPGIKEGIGYAIPARYKDQILKGQTDFRNWKGVATYSISLTLMPFPKWLDPDQIIDKQPGVSICDFPNSFLFPWWGHKGDQIFHSDTGNLLPKDNGRSVRIDYHRWRVGFLFYSSAGVRVKAWKDTRIGGWMSTIKMDNVQLESCIKGKVVIPGLFPQNFHESVSMYATNTNKLEKTLIWAAAPMHVEVLPEHFNIKFKVTYKGQPISRSVRE
ncbi:hypothetical protein [Sphingobacterium sp. UBA5670]|uniref:hypothetical protein n=1 Tax=Sphingobacterium sp. UBA5670 TaxID=1947502 RepID=UPI0025EB775F|nr:hypothetical protein [Sphingobacterium sp. UBA5670]